MAASLPDPREFKSWEDAFQQPLLAVRRFEQQLRSNAAENREKLRSLVGGSYRDLLGTAERICDMDETMQGIETTLGSTASKCNSVVVDKIFANTVVLNAESTSRSKQQNGLAAQMSVLRNCQSAMTQLLKKDDQLDVAAKVLVLGRLVHKTLSHQENTPPLVETLRNRLALSRTKLLNSIDRSFSDPDVDTQLLVSNMCAFSLATNSAPTDVLRHFLHIRLEAICNVPSTSRDARSSMIKAVRLLKNSLFSVHVIFPKRLADALGRVKLQPLAQDKDIESLSVLNLDIYGRWIADEVRNYTPWPRHDELQRAEADKITRSWVPAAISSLRSCLKEILKQQDDFQTVLRLWEAVLEAHLTSNERALGAQASDLLDVIREPLNDRLTELVKMEAGSIQILARQINSIAESLPAHESKEPLWNLADEASSLNDGSAAFKDAIRSRLHGYDDRLKSCMESAKAWEEAVTKARIATKGMRERRWEDDILDAGADTDDDFDLDSKQALLSEDDPRALEEALNGALKSSLVKFGNTINAVIENNGAPETAMFLIRIMRDLAQKASTLNVKFDHLSLCRPLFQTLAVSSTKQSLQAYESSLQRFTEAPRLTAMALWEGHPALPSQPMTCTFKFMRKVTQSMAEVGQDLWSPALVDSLKDHVASRLVTNFKVVIDDLHAITAAAPASPTLNGQTNGISKTDSESAGGKNGDQDSESEAPAASEQEAEVNGDNHEEMPRPSTSEKVPNPPEDDISQSEQAQQAARDMMKLKAQQLFFDVCYLQKTLNHSSQTPSEKTFEGITSTITDITGLSSDQHNKIQKGANDYWRKTYLLFGLLV